MSKNLKFLIVSSALLLSIALNAFAQEKTASITSGDLAPDFSLRDNFGKQINLSEAVKNGPVVLVFYRGSWCPFCVHQLSDLRGLLKPGETTQLYAISIDPAETSNELVKKIEKDDKGKVNYSFLSDPGAKTIDAYGLRDPRYKDEAVYGIPYPTVYVIDSERKVTWAKIEQDYKQRPTNEEIRAAVDKLNSVNSRV